MQIHACLLNARHMQKLAGTCLTLPLLSLNLSDPFRQCAVRGELHHPAYIAPYLAHVLPKLKQLWLCKAFIDDHGVAVLVADAAPRLQTLGLDDNRIKPGGAKMIDDAFRSGRLPCLRQLHLCGNYISPSDRRALPFLAHSTYEVFL